MGGGGGEAITGRLSLGGGRGSGRLGEGEFIFYPYGGIWTTTSKSAGETLPGGEGISNKYFTSAVRIMGTFNSNPSQLPSHFSLRPPPLLPLPLAQRRVRHLQENTSKSFAGCGNNKYRRSGGGGKGGETVRLLASDVCLQFVAKNNGKIRH